LRRIAFQESALEDESEPGAGRFGSSPSRGAEIGSGLGLGAEVADAWATGTFGPDGPFSEAEPEPEVAPESGEVSEARNAGVTEGSSGAGRS
jgi:hypothetical protein